MKKWLIIIGVITVVYLGIGLYLYADFGDRRVIGIGSKYSNSHLDHSMGDSKTWNITSVYIPENIWCRYPGFLQSESSMQVFMNYIALPWAPVKWCILRMNYECLYQNGDLYSVVTRERADEIIKEDGLTYVTFTSESW